MVEWNETCPMCNQVERIALAEGVLLTCRCGMLCDRTTWPIRCQGARTILRVAQGKEKNGGHSELR